MEETGLKYHYDNLMKKSEWLFVTPTATNIVPKIVTQECGRFFFDGHSFTERTSLKSYEIGFLMSDAEFTLRYSGRVYSFGHCGDLFFIDCTRGYRIESNGYCDSYFVHFWGENIQYYYEIFEKYNNGSPVINLSGLPIGAEFEKILSIYRNPSDETADLYAQSSIMKLIQSVIQTVMPLYSTQQNSQYIIAAIEYIKEHISDTLTLDRVARQISISRSYLAMLFRRETGLTFSMWVKKYRINKAKELLKNTDMSQDDICSEIGIYDSSYLCRLFRENEKLTPDEYRKNWRII